MKIRSVGAELFHGSAGAKTDGKTNKHGEDNRHFSQLCKSA